MNPQFLVVLLQFLAGVMRIIEVKIVAEAERKQSGKLDVIHASILTLKTSRDPKERREAAIKLKQARGR